MSPTLGGLVARAAAAAVILALAATGCTASDDSVRRADAALDTATAPSDTTLTKPKRRPFQAKLVELGGGVKASQRAAVKKAVAKPVDEWIEGAFVAPTYPTSDFRAGLASWTPKGCRRRRKRDRATTPLQRCPRRQGRRGRRRPAVGPALRLRVRRQDRRRHRARPAAADGAAGRRLARQGQRRRRSSTSPARATSGASSPMT